MEEWDTDEGDFMSKFCGNCGTKLDDNEMFCSNCGSKVEDTGTEQETENSTIVENTVVNTSEPIKKEKKKFEYDPENPPKQNKAVGCLIMIIFLGIIVGGIIGANFINKGSYGNATGLWYVETETDEFILAVSEEGGEIFSSFYSDKLYKISSSEESFTKMEYKFEFVQVYGSGNSRYVLDIKPNANVFTDGVEKMNGTITYYENGNQESIEEAVFDNISNNDIVEQIEIYENYVGEYKGKLRVNEVFDDDFDTYLNSDIDVSFVISAGQYGGYTTYDYDTSFKVYSDNDFNAYAIEYGTTMVLNLLEQEKSYDEWEFNDNRFPKSAEVRIDMKVVLSGDGLVGYFDLYRMGNLVMNGEVKLSNK